MNEDVTIAAFHSKTKTFHQGESFAITLACLTNELTFCIDKPCSTKFWGSFILRMGDFLCFAGTNFCDWEKLFFLLGINFCVFQEVAFYLEL